MAARIDRRRTTVECARLALELDERLTAEELQVRLWRFDQLVAHGYAAGAAERIASDTRIDLEHARRLVSELDCPPRLAVRILT